jgi:dTDP-glucose 4,6-dehydratase
VRDHCAAIERVWREGRVGEVYNIGGRCEITNLELTHRLLDLLGKPRSLIKFVPDRPAHDYRYSLDSAKIRRLGWRRRYDFARTLEETVAWYMENPGWWRKIKTGDYLEYYRRQYGAALAGA